LVLLYACWSASHLQFLARHIRRQRGHLIGDGRRFGAVRRLRADQCRFQRVDLLRVRDARRFDDGLRTVALAARLAQVAGGGRVRRL
jgi:hypothetical protein